MILKQFLTVYRGASVDTGGLLYFNNAYYDTLKQAIADSKDIPHQYNWRPEPQPAIELTGGEIYILTKIILHKYDDDAKRIKALAKLTDEEKILLGLKKIIDLKSESNK